MLILTLGANNKRVCMFFKTINEEKPKSRFRRAFLIISCYIAFIPFLNEFVFTLFQPNLAYESPFLSLPTIDPLNTFRLSTEFVRLGWYIPDLLNSLPYPILTLVISIITFYLTRITLHGITNLVFYIWKGFSQKSRINS